MRQAPFTPIEVEKLNEYQDSGRYHPFTCGGEDRSKCPNEGTLIAKEEGWICPCGKYKQDWCHDFMCK